MGLSSALALAACDGGEAPRPDAAPAAAPAMTPAKVTPEPAPVVQPADPPPANDKVKVAAAIAREISAAPELADEILGKHGLDRDRFDAIMFEIAGDPAMTKAYMAARRAK